MKLFIIIVLAICFIYMIVWTVQYVLFTKRQKRVKRIQELRAKENNVPSDTQSYWYNKRDVQACENETEVKSCYHFFRDTDDAIHELLLEMYDCGIVRMDELEKISYGRDRFQDMDLSFLQAFENENLNNHSQQDDTHMDHAAEQNGDVDKSYEVDDTDEVIQVDGLMGGFFNNATPDVITASKELKSNDPGITDIHGTLSAGVENVLAAVEAEKKQAEKDMEPILIKEEKSIEEARKSRAQTSNAEIRNQIYTSWSRYVEELLSLIVIHATPQDQQKIGKGLMDYGYNDVDILLEGPEY